MLNRLVSAVAGAVLLAGASGAALAASPGSPINMTRIGNAIHGYDPVAYHELGEAIVGDPDISYEWRHATWLFAKQAHRDLFAADPDKYMPAYGGYCAFAVTFGLKLDVDPHAWSIVGDRLFLNESMVMRRAWHQDTEHYVENGDLSWEEIKYK